MKFPTLARDERLEAACRALRAEVRAFLREELASGGFTPECDSWLRGYDRAEQAREVGAEARGRRLIEKLDRVDQIPVETSLRLGEREGHVELSDRQGLLAHRPVPHKNRRNRRLGSFRTVGVRR